jgi:hypothetical protein
MSTTTEIEGRTNTPSRLGCRRCGGWGYIRMMVPAACPTCDLCNGTGADSEQPVASHPPEGT